MICTVENFDTYNLLTVKGSISNEYLDNLRDNMVVTFEGDNSVLIDIKGVDFICSAGLSVFLQFTGNAGDRKVFYCGPNNSLQNLFQITGVDQTLKFVSTLEEAVTALQN